MKALLLVGGFGTRLRPLTLTIPKPLVDFCNKPILEHQVDALVKCGVDHIILAVAYKAESIQQTIKTLEAKYKVRVECSVETKQLGTAGPIRLAEALLTDHGAITDPETPFFVLNSDIVCDFPLTKMLEFHREKRAAGTILSTQVEDTSKFGVIVSDDDHRIQKFVEKPTTFISSSINAGVYILNTSVIQTIPLRETSIEKEIFPVLATQGRLFCFDLQGFWADVGQPDEYLQGMIIYLESLRQREDPLLASGPNIHGNVVVDPSAQIHPNAHLGPNVAIGPDCVIGDGAFLNHCAIMKGSIVSSYCVLRDAIVGNTCRLHPWVRIHGLTVLGENVVVKQGVFIRSAFVLPHKSISEDEYDVGKIIM